MQSRKDRPPAPHPAGFPLALRTLRRQPAFTAAALIALAFGIGANTILFTIINAIALRPIPVVDGHTMVRVQPSTSAVGIAAPFHIPTT